MGKKTLIVPEMRGDARRNNPNEPKQRRKWGHFSSRIVRCGLSVQVTLVYAVDWNRRTSGFYERALNIPLRLGSRYRKHSSCWLLPRVRLTYGEGRRQNSSNVGQG